MSGNGKGGPAHQNQLVFLETVVRENLDAINKQLIRGSRRTAAQHMTQAEQFAQHAEPVVYAMQDERIHFAQAASSGSGRDVGTLVHRIFVNGIDYPEYRTVGWLLYDDVDFCVICNTAFGFFTYKYYCYACGNIVCHACSPYTVIISELSDAGLKRCCTQCCWGQDEVTAVHTYKDPNAPKRAIAANTNTNGAGYGGSNTVNLLEKATSHVEASTPASMKNNGNGRNDNNGNGSNRNSGKNLNSSFSEPTVANIAYINSCVSAGAPNERGSFSSTTSSNKAGGSGQKRNRPSLVISAGIASGYVLVTPTPGFVIEILCPQTDE
jgi:hypothetical protein